MTEDLALVADAFSRKALEYDAFLLDHVNLARMRQKVYDHVLTYLQPADRILELNAGTGTDAVFFARRGFHVHATDLSPGMIAQIEDKVVRYELGHRLTVQQCSFTDLDSIAPGPYQHVLSNFGGLNCIPDLRPIARALPALVSPGAVVTWVIMPRVCLWELALIFRGQWRTALRRQSRGGVLANVAGVRFRTYYFAPRQAVSSLGPSFRPFKLVGLSVFTPPADRKGFAKRHPRLYRSLVHLDDWLSPLPPFRGWGDFYILSMRYDPQ